MAEEGAAYIGTLNLVVDQVPGVAGSFDPNYPGTNTLDGLSWSQARAAAAGSLEITYDFGAAVTVDAVGIAAHNLATDPAGAFSVLYSDDNVGFTEYLAPTTRYGAQAMFFANLASESHRYWRFVLSNTVDAPSVGVCWLGVATQLWNPVFPPFTPPTFDRNNRLLSNFGNGGAILGSSVLRHGGQTRFQIQQAPWSWLEGTFQADYKRITEAIPFMFTWDNAAHQAQAAYCIAPTNPAVQYISHGRGNFTVNVQTL